MEVQSSSRSDRNQARNQHNQDGVDPHLRSEKALGWKRSALAQLSELPFLGTIRPHVSRKATGLAQLLLVPIESRQVASQAPNGIRFWI